MVAAMTRPAVRDLLANIDERTFLERVPIDQMFVDQYGRPVGSTQIGRMLKRGFREDLLGIVTLSMRADGRYAIIDGNHRKHIAQHFGLTTLLARVFIDLTYEQEAEMFEALNTIKPPSSIDRWRARIGYHDEQALAITKILDEVGLRVANNHRQAGTGVIVCVGALDQVYSNYGSDTLRAVIHVLHAAWEYDPSAYSGAMVTGLTAFWARYHGDARLDRLVEQLRTTTPHRILGAAGQLSNAVEPARTSIGKQIAAIYTGRSRRYLLPEWKHFADETLKRANNTRSGKAPGSGVTEGRRIIKRTTQ